MGFLSDVFFGLDSGSAKRSGNGGWMEPRFDDDYYEDLHDDAINGDFDARDEMREEFGDDWDEEY